MLNRSTESTKRQMKTGQEKVTAEIVEVKKDTAEMKIDISDMKKVIADVVEVKKETSEVKL